MNLKFMKESETNFDANEVVRSGFGLARADKGNCIRFELSVSTLALLLKGKVTVTKYATYPQFVESGNMGIFPISRFHNITMEEDSTVVFLYIIGDSRSFCRRILSEESIRKMQELKGQIFTLPIKPTLLDFAKQIEHYIDNSHRFNIDIRY